MISYDGVVMKDCYIEAAPDFVGKALVVIEENVTDTVIKGCAFVGAETCGIFVA